MRLLPEAAGSSLPPITAIQSTIARRSLAEFVKRSWHILEPTTKLIWNWHLDAICDHVQALLEGRIPKRNLYLAVPPGSMKSRIVSVCAPAWWWIDHPSFRFIFSSANPRVTLRDSMYCRELIESKWYQEGFRPDWTFAADQNAKSLYRNTKGGFRQATSAGAKITGDRGDGLFWDDLLDAADAPSKAARDSVNYWYDNAFANRLSDPDHTGIRCGIGQRLHEDDPAGHVAAGGEYEFVEIPQNYEPPNKTPLNPAGAKMPTSIGWTDPRTKDNELMFPARFGAKYLAAELLRLTPAGYAAQHGQRPAPAGGIIFKRDWWKYFQMPEGDPAKIIEQLRIRRLAVGWDTALTEKTSSDYTSFHVIGQSDTGFYVLAHEKFKRQYPEVEAEVIAQAGKWKPQGVPVEGEGSHSGKVVVQALRAKTTIPVVEVPNIDKLVRAARVSPTVFAGNVFLPMGAEWVADFVNSLASFPRGVHDDDVDSFTITLEWLLFGESTTGMLEYYRQLAEEELKRQQEAKGAA